MISVNVLHDCCYCYIVVLLCIYYLLSRILRTRTVVGLIFEMGYLRDVFGKFRTIYGFSTVPSDRIRIPKENSPNRLPH